ncbi:MAG: Gldg family protein [Synechococcales bacterium]|nr:Gldg family protein [Synechococcales bacterium]
MKLSILSKFPWSLFFWLGPILLIAGVTAGLVVSFSPIPLTMTSVGGVITGAWLIIQAIRPHPVDTLTFWNRRSTQSGANALVTIGALFLVLGMVNFLGTRYTFRLDLTEAQVYSLYPQSQAVVKKLKEPVKVWVFSTAKNPQDEALLDNYRKQNSAFNFEFADPQARPALAEKFGVKAQGDVYLESGQRRQYIQTVNPQERLSEAKLTTTLEQLGSGRQEKVYFLQGHGEYTPQQLSLAYSYLVDKNYTNVPLNLAELGSGKSVAIPEDANVVIIAGPKRALFKTEVDALKTYLQRGRGLMVMIDPNTNPELDNLLNEWGVTLDPRLIIDAGGVSPQGGIVGYGPAAPLVTRYGEHPITKDLQGGNSFYPQARPVVTTPTNGITSSPLLYTNSQSWAESNIQDNGVQFDQGKDLKGPLTLGVALEKDVSKPSPSPLASPNPDGPILKQRLVVIGNSRFMTDGLFTQQLNGDVFLNSVTWLSQRTEQVLSIRPKEAKDRRIVLSSLRGNMINVIALLGLPLLGFVMAGILWWKRR